MKKPFESTALVPADSGRLPDNYVQSGPVPRLVAAAGDKATRRFLEFFAATIHNQNTFTRQAWQKRRKVPSSAPPAAGPAS